MQCAQLRGEIHCELRTYSGPTPDLLRTYYMYMYYSRRGGTSLGICGQPCRDLKSVEFCGAVDWNANVAEVEGMIQVFLQVLNMREAPPQIGIVYDSDYAYRGITWAKPINKNGALVGVARVLYHRVQWRTKVS
jgi:hypothetical protein